MKKEVRENGRGQERVAAFEYDLEIYYTMS